VFIRRTLPNWHGDRGEMNIDLLGELPDGACWSFRLADVWSYSLPFQTRHRVSQLPRKNCAGAQGKQGEICGTRYAVAQGSRTGKAAT
jgi:hypothetical protein